MTNDKVFIIYWRWPGRSNQNVVVQFRIAPTRCL